MTKSQIDKLGERLKRQQPISDQDLRLLDEYRRSFDRAYETVVGTLREDLFLAPTGRPAKSTQSITEKLRRESLRLSQMQDIAGCRVIVEDIKSQEIFVNAISHRFEKANTFDRREKPSHGYRAVHIVAQLDDKAVEIQVRTALQHLWAECSEKLSDVIDISVKYGGGPQAVRSMLINNSSLVAELEELEKLYFVAGPILRAGSPPSKLPDQTVAQKVRMIKAELANVMQNIIIELEKGRKQ